MFPLLLEINLNFLIYMQMCCPETKAPDLCEDDGFYEDLNMDDVDLDLENYEQLFGVAFNDPEHLFGNDGIGSLFGVKGISAAEVRWPYLIFIVLICCKGRVCWLIWYLYLFLLIVLGEMELDR